MDTSARGFSRDWTPAGSAVLDAGSRRHSPTATHVGPLRGPLEFGHSSHHTPCDVGLDAPACPRQVHFSDFALHGETLPSWVKCDRAVFRQGVGARRSKLQGPLRDRLPATFCVEPCGPTPQGSNLSSRRRSLRKAMDIVPRPRRGRIRSRCNRAGKACHATFVDREIAQSDMRPPLVLRREAPRKPPPAPARSVMMMHDVGGSSSRMIDRGAGAEPD